MPQAGAFGALVEALVRYGRLSLAEVITPALGVARDGFPAHAGLLRQHGYGIPPWPTSSAPCGPGPLRLGIMSVSY